MKAFIRHVVTALTVAVVCQARVDLAEECLVSDHSKTTSEADDQNSTATVQSSGCVEDSSYAETCSSEAGLGDGLFTASQPCRVWYVDTRFQQMFDSNTSFQYGNDDREKNLPSGPYTPMSKLAYSLDATWAGLRVGVQKPNWDIHFDGLMPVGTGINGGMRDYDWNINEPKNDPTRLDSLWNASTRWNEGLKLELEGEFQWSDHFFGLPLAFWPLAGFRYQRFDMTAFAGNEIVGDRPGPAPNQGDVLTLNQQYYIGYIGFQLRGVIAHERRPPITVTFQADYGGTGGYNVDYHLFRGFHEMMSTGGGALHVALIADAAFNSHFGIGLQADHMEIRTTGSLLQIGDKGDWSSTDYGVQANSDQTSLTAYLRVYW